MTTLTNYKVIALASELLSDLTVRCSSAGLNLAVPATVSFNSSGQPTISIGTGSAGAQNVFIQVVPVSTINLDVLGLNQVVFTPSIIQVALETSTIANVPLLTIKNELPILAAVCERGTRVEVYLSSNGVAPTGTAITGTPAAVFEPQVQYPLMADM